MSLLEYIKQQGFPEDIHHTVDGIFAVEWSTDLDAISVNQIKKWNSGWQSGEKNFLLRNQSHIEVFKKKFSNILDNVQLNTPVASITQENSGQITIKDLAERTYTADFVVVSVPVSQLKKGRIRFEPDLPVAKKEALKQITMMPTMKVFLKFKTRIWAEDLGNIITTGVIKLAWVSSAGGKSASSHVLTALITGRNAERLSQLSDTEIKDAVMEDLKRVYGNHVEQELVGFIVKDWTKEEYIEGGYSFPNIDETEDTRTILREPIMNERLFFAGEWTADKFGPMTGALESSHTAYKSICKVLAQDEYRKIALLQKRKFVPKL